MPQSATEQSPLVTIRCTVYNHETYIADALEGFVRQQTTFPFEAVVHDDASTDASADIIRRYAERYPDIIRPIYETENQYSKSDGSLGRVMESHTRGKYIALCEGDDYWTDPTKLQRQVDFMESHPDVGLCYTDCDILHEDDGSREREIFGSGRQERFNEANPLLPRRGWYTANMTWLYRRDILNRMPRWNDVIDTALQMLCHFALVSRVAYLPGSTGVYRRHVGSASMPADSGHAFEYAVNTFFLKDRLLRLFPDSRHTLAEHYDNALFSLYAQALERGNGALTRAYTRFYPAWFLALVRREIRRRRERLPEASLTPAWRLMHLLRRLRLQ